MNEKDMKKTGLKSRYVLDESTGGLFMWQVICVAATVLLCNHLRDKGTIHEGTEYWVAVIGGGIFALWFAYWFHETIWGNLLSWITSWVPGLSS